MLQCVLAFAVLRCGCATSSVSMRLLKDGHFVLERLGSQGRHDLGGSGSPRWAPTPEEEASKLGQQWPRSITVEQRGSAVVEAGSLVLTDRFATRTLSRAGIDERPVVVGGHAVAHGHLLPKPTPCRTSSLSAVKVVVQEDPSMPKQIVKTKPASWTSKAWSMYQTAYKTLAPLRGGVGNVAATFAAMGLGPENCVLKLAYSMYYVDDEDDYPYMPRGCGDGFSYTIGGAVHWFGSVALPWPMLAGLLTVSSAWDL
mmetsp:Transcript_61946/g.199763  ORF Transcript_61946/g.199763 Transcript_61946/m.199763 type:complete len:256 (+) Transcript_61946:79-846(+)